MCNRFHAGVATGVHCARREPLNLKPELDTPLRRGAYLTKPVPGLTVVKEFGAHGERSRTLVLAVQAQHPQRPLCANPLRRQHPKAQASTCDLGHDTRNIRPETELV